MAEMMMMNRQLLFNYNGALGWSMTGAFSVSNPWPLTWTLTDPSGAFAKPGDSR